MKFHGRKKPYTEIGISRVPCARCGKSSVFQWSICANNHHYLGFCGECDIAMNAMVLAFIGANNADELMKWYATRIGYAGACPTFVVNVPALET